MKHKTTREHYEKYRNMAKKAGISLNEGSYFPTVERLISLHEKDPNLNNIPLSKFDRLFNPHRPNFPRTLGENTCMYKHLLVYDVLGCEPEFTD